MQHCHVDLSIELQGGKAMSTGREWVAGTYGTMWIHL